MIMWQDISPKESQRRVRYYIYAIFLPLVLVALWYTKKSILAGEWDAIILMIIITAILVIPLSYTYMTQSKLEGKKRASFDGTDFIFTDGKRLPLKSIDSISMTLSEDNIVFFTINKEKKKTLEKYRSEAEYMSTQSMQHVGSTIYDSKEETTRINSTVQSGNKETAVVEVIDRKGFEKVLLDNGFKKWKTSREIFYNKDNHIPQEYLVIKKIEENKYAQDTPEGFFDRFVPTYDEASTFYLSLAIWMVAIYEFKELFPVWTATSITILACIILGTLLSIYHAFSNKSKSYLIKVLFMYYLALITGLISVGATIYQMAAIFDKEFQIISFVIMMLSIYCTIMISMTIISNFNNSVKKFSDRNASITEIIIGSAVVIATSLICRYYFNMHWTLILSISLIYIVGIHRSIIRQFMPENIKEE